ncbi:MAG: acetolactate synthase small subunit [bacterium]|nr:acetolactate synthase small subunit [bacterium]
MRQIFSVLVNNHAGVLSHVAGLFTRRGYNIESVAAGPTENPETTRITIVAFGENAELEQIAKQLGKLYDVQEITQLNYNTSITRELVLATIYAGSEKRNEVIQLANAFGANVIGMSDETITLEISGNDHKVYTVIKALERYGISRMARTGMIALPYEKMPSDWEPLN